MARIRRMVLQWTTGFTNSDATDGTFIPMADFFASLAVEQAQMEWEAWGETVANMITRPGYQVADVPNNILATNTLGTDTKTGSGEKFPTAMTSIASVTQGKQLIRPGSRIEP